MKLFILRPIDPNADDSPWNPWYDKVFGVVVRAKTEQDARQLAGEGGGDEVYDDGTNPWWDETLTSCEELLPDGDVKVIMVDYHSA